ncbi:MAG: hypothetical protein WCO62_08325 [Betaproteobacteria bacterium]
MIDKGYPPEFDIDQDDNKYFAEAFPDADSPAELYRQVYKYTDCGAYLSMTIEYMEVSGTCFDDYHEQIVQKTLHCDELRHLGTWKAMDERGQLVVSFTVGSIVEGVDEGTDNIEVEARRPDEEPSKYRSRFYAALKEVEDQAESIWNDTHGCESCAAYWTDQGLDIDDSGGLVPVYKYCPDCNGTGIAI